MAKADHTTSAPRARFMLKSHVDFAQEPFGKVFFYLITDESGLILCSFTGGPGDAKDVCASMGVESISWARWLELRDKETA